MNFYPYKFKDLYLEPSKNGVYKSSQFMGSGVPIVKMNELFDKLFIDSNLLGLDKIELTENEKTRFLLQNNDLLFSRTSVVPEGVGKCSIVTEVSDELAFESNLIRIRLDSQKVSPKFIFYFFQSSLGRGKVLGISNGAAIRTIRGSDLAELEFSLPEKNVQDRVADILSAYDDLIENNRRRIDLLEQSARLLYKEWFVSLRFPGHEHVKVKDGVPQGWEKKRLADWATLVMGQSPASEHYNTDGDGFPFHQGVTNFGDRFVTHKTYCKIEGRMAEAGDILCSVRAPVGRLNITLDRIVLGRGVSAIRSYNGFQSFLYYQLKNHFFKEDMIGGGAIFASVTKKDMENQLLLCPPDRLIEDFEQNSKPIDEQLKTLHLQNQKLQQARDLLLPRLMNGEIPV